MPPRRDIDRLDLFIVLLAVALLGTGSGVTYLLTRPASRSAQGVTTLECDVLCGGRVESWASGNCRCRPDAPALAAEEPATRTRPVRLVPYTQEHP